MCSSRVSIPVAYALLAAPAFLIGILHMNLKDVAIYSEQELMNVSVLHPFFNSDEHYAGEFWQPSMKQQQRLDALSAAVDGTFRALSSIGVPAFLESAGLIGWLRHNGNQLPWDTDGDLGILFEDCQKANVSKRDLEQIISNDLVVLKFACVCEEDCEGDNHRMVGRIAHRSTGVCIDIFAYAPVQRERKWQHHKQYEGVEWWERVHDHADFTFPRSTLLPLQEGTFAGHPILLPAAPQEFLSWEYGRCLGVHLWPWRLLLYTPVSVLVPTAIIAKGALILSGGSAGKAKSPWFAVCIGAYAAICLAMFKNGISLLALFLVSLCELLAVLIRPELGFSGRRNRHLMSITIVLCVLLYEFRGSLEQLLCQIDDFYLHPRRPKTWTLCLFGTCWDF